LAVSPVGVGVGVSVVMTVGMVAGGMVVAGVVVAGVVVAGVVVAGVVVAGVVVSDSPQANIRDNATINRTMHKLMVILDNLFFLKKMFLLLLCIRDYLKKLDYDL
jgi:hypothetical protein